MVEIVGGRKVDRAAFGNESFAVPLVGTETCTAAYGGTHPPIFIPTCFEVRAAIVSFECEFDQRDVDIIYDFKDDRSAACIRVRDPIDPEACGFFVDFCQGGGEGGFNEPFILKFNWLAVGRRSAFCDEFCNLPPEPEEDCCANGSKPKSLTVQYTGQGCLASSHSQDDPFCVGDPNFANPVFIIANNKKNDFGGHIFFSGMVNLNGTFDIDAEFAGRDCLSSNVWIHIFDQAPSSGNADSDDTGSGSSPGSGGGIDSDTDSGDIAYGTETQKIKIHTSCSQPLFVNDQFGSIVIQGCEPCDPGISTDTGDTDSEPTGTDTDDTDGAGDTDSDDKPSTFNNPPTITSTPILNGLEGESYAYQVVGVDPDPGDTLTYTLPLAPPGALIHQVTGLISWVPSFGQSGPNNFTVRVTDSGGLFAEQSFTVNITNLNRAPIITSAPVTTGLPDTTYTYDVSAADPDSEDVITYSLVTSPSGVTINSSSGLIVWTPGFEDVGAHSFKVRATDLGGLFDEQTWTVNVSDVNRSPTITTVAPTTGTEGVLYSYDVDATDPDGDALTYTMPIAPTGATINSSTGLITWTPDFDQAGAHSFVVRVTDPEGLSDEQSFTVTVADVNRPPVIVSSPVTAATEDVPYTYDVNATDPDGDVITYSLRIAPAGAIINPVTGLITWTPGFDQSGTQSFTVRATDVGGLFDEQSFDVLVADTNRPPTITSTPDLSVIEGLAYTYDVNATDPDNDIITYTLTTAPIGATIDSSTGSIAWTPTSEQVGANSFTVRATDAGGLFDEQTFSVTVAGLAEVTDCCDNGKLRILRFKYTGQDCNASSHSQGSTHCSGNPNFADPVFIIVNDKKNPSRGRIYFSEEIRLNEVFTADAKKGETGWVRKYELRSNIWLHVYDREGGSLIHRVRIHSSCSKPLFTGDQFGAFIVVDSVSSAEDTGKTDSDSDSN